MGRTKKTYGLILLAFLVSCGHISDRRLREGPRPKAETRPVPGEADEVGFWNNDRDPQKSALIGNDKSASGALYVYDLQGQIIDRSVHINRPTGVSVRHNIRTTAGTYDVVGCGVRSTNEIKIFAIDPETRKLTDITSPKGIPTGFEKDTYGFCLYKRSKDGQLFAFVTRKGTDHIHQILLTDDGTGKIEGKLIRKFGKENMKSFVEGMVADDEYGYLYCSDEDYAILKFYADPNVKKGPFIQSFGVRDGIQGDREGLALYKKPHGKGYLIVSSQGDSAFKIYQREGSNKFVKSAALRGVRRTDGIATSSLSIPPLYPSGVFAAHNDTDNNYVLFDWYEFSRLK
ncbi:MAG: phytase [Chlamydiia bacterium]|nr:phytase [Chlamydiia bacterium]